MTIPQLKELDLESNAYWGAKVETYSNLEWHCVDGAILVDAQETTIHENTGKARAVQVVGKKKEE